MHGKKCQLTVSSSIHGTGAMNAIRLNIFNKLKYVKSMLFIYIKKNNRDRLQ